MSKDPILVTEGRNIGRDVLQYHGADYEAWTHTPEAKKVMDRMRNGEMETYVPNTVCVADLVDYYAEHVLPYAHSQRSFSRSGSMQAGQTILSRGDTPTEWQLSEARRIAEERLDPEKKKREMENLKRLRAAARSDWETSFDRKMREQAEKEAAEEAKRLTEERAKQAKETIEKRKLEIGQIQKNSEYEYGDPIEDRDDDSLAVEPVSKKAETTETSKGISSQLRTADDYRRWAAEQDKRFEETNPEIAKQRALKDRFEIEK